MKINNNVNTKRKSRTLLIIILAILVLLAGATAFFYYNSQNTQKSDADAIEKAEQQEQIQKDIKQEAAEENKPNNTETPQPNTENPDSVTVTITSPSLQSVSNFRLRAFIDKATTEGSCSLILTATGKPTITKTVTGLQPNNQISGCPDITISSAELSTGTWDAKLVYESTSSTGSTSQTIIVE